MTAAEPVVARNRVLAFAVDATRRILLFNR